jgi:hypothetical protein
MRARRDTSNTSPARRPSPPTEDAQRRGDEGFYRCFRIAWRAKATSLTMTTVLSLPLQPTCLTLFGFYEKLCLLLLPCGLITARHSSVHHPYGRSKAAIVMMHSDSRLKPCFILQVL